jgi:hypothetical protein
MDLFGMLPRRFQPRADSMGLHAESVFDGNNGTPPTHQRNDLRDGCLVGTASVKDRAGAGTEGLPADAAAVAPLCLTMHTNIALPDQAACGTIQIGAPYLLRIHGVLLLFGHTGFSMDSLIC